MRKTFLLIYGVSGAAALIYEVVWTRFLTLSMGHTVAAASTVLAAFMGGLAFGAWLAGRVVDNRKRLMTLYAMLEIGIAIFAIGLPGLIDAAQPVLKWAYANGAAPMRFALIRLALSFVALTIPASAMGATFPIAAAWSASIRGAGALYAANTAGAAAGAIAAGFWLIPQFGLRETTYWAVCLNVISAAGALWIARAEVPAHAGMPLNRRKGRQKDAIDGREPRAQAPLAWAAIGISGFCALTYEVAFTRLLTVVIGPTTYAFSTIAGAFVTGIAAGSLVGTRVADRISRPLIWLGISVAGSAAAAAAVSAFIASRFPIIVASRVMEANAAFSSIVFWQASAVFVLLFPVTFFLGFAFPVALVVAAPGRDRVGRNASLVYGANTVGAVAGALSAGFVLIPRWGLQSTFLGISSIGMACGFGLVVKGVDKRAPARFAVLGCAVVVAALLFFVPEWDRNLLSSGAYKYARQTHTDDRAVLRASLRAGRLEYYKDGAAATVAVRDLAGTKSLAIDGKVDASNGGDMLTQRALGALPVLLHADPRNVAVIGLGSGVTASSALATGLVRHVDVIEISPEVVEASRFFSQQNGDVLRSSRVRLVVGDGRSHLRLSSDQSDQYDVIVSEPSNPWMAGVAALFTREFFSVARKQLNPGGILCQWTHTYDMSSADLASIVRTFASVFPVSTMWLIGEGDLLLIGGVDDHPGDLNERLTRLMTRSQDGSITAALHDVGIERETAGFQLASLFAGGPAEIAKLADDGILQTDDRMALEFSAPQAMYGSRTNVNTAAIQRIASGAALPAPLAAALDNADGRKWRAAGTMAMRAQAYGRAYESFRRSLAVDDTDRTVLHDATDAATAAHQEADHERWLLSVAAVEPQNVPVRLELSRVRAGEQNFDAAVALANEAHSIAPHDAAPLEQLASIYADTGDVGRLESTLSILLTEHPDSTPARYFRAAAAYLRGRAAQAVSDVREAIALDPRDDRAFNLLGAACAATGDRACAARAFSEAHTLNPMDPSAAVNLGRLALDSSDAKAAWGWYAEALALDPTSGPAREGLLQAESALGSRRR